MRLKLTSRGTSDERNEKINGGDERWLVNDATEVRGTFVNGMRDMGGLAMRKSGQFCNPAVEHN